MAKNSISGNGLQDELEFLLAEVGALAGRLRASSQNLHAIDRLPVGGKAVLRTLAQAGSQTVPQLARGRGSSRQNLQVLVNRLESGGLVEFADNPAHRSSVLIRLTTRGEKMLADAMKRESVFLAGLLKHTSEKEVLSAGELLSRLRRLLDGKTGTHPSSKHSPMRAIPKRRVHKVVARPPKPVLEVEALPPDEPVEDGLPFHLL